MLVERLLTAARARLLGGAAGHAAMRLVLISALALADGACGTGSAVASVAPGHAEEFPAVIAGGTKAYPQTIAVGPEGDIWYAEVADKIGQMTPGGAIMGEFTIPAGPGASMSPYGRDPFGIAVGSDGNLWFTDANYDEQEHCYVGRITPDGTAKEFPLSPRYTCPQGIALGPDGDMWFTEPGLFSYGQPGEIGRITPAGEIKEFSIPATDVLGTPPQAGIPGMSRPIDIALGSDGSMWFTDAGTDSEGHHFIGRITPADEITEFKIPMPEGVPGGIALGPEGDMWFTETGAPKIGRVTPTGTISEQRVPSTGGGVRSIVRGLEDDMWFTESSQANALGRITPAGAVSSFSPIATGGGFPGSLAIGPDGNLWFTESETSKIGRFILPPTPTSLQTPTISGQAVTGQTLSVSQGSWSYPPESFSYQWQRCDAAGAGCVDLGGEITASHFLTGEDVGHTLRAAVSVTVLGSSVVAVSSASAVVQTVPLTPTVLQAPPPLTVGEYPIPATMTWTFAWARAYTIVKALAVHGIPVGGYVEVICHGRGCAFAHRRASAHAGGSVCPRGCGKAHPRSQQGEVNLAALFRARHLKVGASISVNVIGSGWIGKSFAFTVRPNRPPRVVIACLAHQTENLSGKC